jgi:hypothetical protein
VKEKWSTGWKNGLRIEPARPSYHDAETTQGIYRFHLLAVRNLHNRKAALDCQVFPTGLRRAGSDKDLLQAPTELKWTGYVFPGARIRPGTARPFDAVVVPHGTPNGGFLNGFTDASDYITQLGPEGHYEIEFEVTSSNFPTARCRALITIGKDIGDSKVELKEIGGDD